MSLRPLVALLLVLATLSSAERALACAGCRNPTMPVQRGNQGPLGEHGLRVGASVTATAVHVVHPDGCEDLNHCHEVPIQPLYEHDQHIYPVELRLTAEYSLSRLFGVELQLPFRSVTTTIRYSTPDGQPYVPLDPDVHHRNETIAGISDPWLLFRAGKMIGKWWLAVRPGLTFPVGKTVENPFALGDLGIRHQHVQLGTGTFDPLLVVETSTKIEKVALAAFAQGQISLYDNSHGYRSPTRLYGGMSAGTKLVGDLSGTLGPEVYHETAERWDGLKRQDGSLGRTELLAAVTLTQVFGKNELSLGVRVPLVRHIVQGSEDLGTLTSPLIASLSYAHSFGGDDAKTAE